MADDLKRVGLKFTAEGAVDFKSTLKSVSNAAHENRSELKLLESQYTKNTSSTQKLQDKQKYLQKQTEIYSDKVEILQRQLDEEKSKEDADADAIAKKTAELNTAKAALNKYQSSLDDVTKALQTHSAQIQDFGNNLKDIGGKLEGVGSALTKGVTAPVGAAAAASVAAWKEVDDAMDTITTKTGASGVALDDMQKRAKSIAETIPVSFGEAGTAIGEVNTRFGLTGQALQDLSGQFLKFSKINGTDVNSSIDSVQKALAAFGLSADDAGAMLDTLNSVGQNTGVSMDTLTSTMVTNGAAFRELGFSASDAATLIGNLEKSGINVNDVMTGLKKALAEASSSGESMSDVLTRAFSSAADASDVFGAKAGPGLYNAMQSGVLSMDMFTAGTTDLDDAMGSVSDTFDSTLDPLDSTTQALNTLKDLGAQIVDSSAPMLTQAIQGLVGFVTDLKNGWEALPEGMQQGIIQFALMSAAVGPVILGIGKLSTGVGGLITNFGAALAKTGSLGGAFVSFAGGPATVIIAAILAVVAALVYLWNNSETFRNIVTVVWMTVQSVVETAVNLIKGYWENILRPVLQAIGDFLNGVLKPIFMAVFNAISAIVSTVFGAIKGLWDTILHPVFSAIGSAAKAMLDAVSGPLNAIRNKFVEIFDGIKSFLSPVINWLKGIFNFSWSLPRIKLPHFSMSGKFSLNPPSVPHLSVEWYRKAMDSGVILTSPTIFGMQGDRLLAGGEAGPEVVVGRDSLASMIRSSTQSAVESSTYGDIYITVYGAEGQDVKALADEIEERITQKIKRRQKVFG